MKPTKKTAATDARINARRRLLFFGSGVMVQLKAGYFSVQPITRVAVMSSLGGVSKV